MKNEIIDVKGVKEKIKKRHNKNLKKTEP